MKATYADNEIAIFDDVLPQDQFAELWTFCQNEVYASVHDGGRQPVWRIGDGEPLKGTTFAWPSVPIDGLIPPGIDLSKAPLKFYPTRTPVDSLLKAAKARCATVENLIGKEGHAWAGITASPFVYPVGTGVSWHHDAGPYSGAMIYYAHPEWNVLWGGELLVADRPSGTTEPANVLATPSRLHTFDNRHENDALFCPGMGRFVMPKPNRLVFLAGGTPHMISKVMPAAGNHVRVSIAGFFVTPNGVAQMAQQYLEQLAAQASRR
ncbi:hypothetical protein [Sorangium sp. So ce1335]|uniref:hypothetical protein n=1 Tax=Sorangium sp. So ce1335 TaxID=3133335 RepID=UPI003F601678